MDKFSSFERDGSGYIWLPVEVSGIPDKIDVNGLELLRKSSFHVTLVYLKTMPNFNQDIEIQVFNLLRDFSVSVPIKFLGYTGEFRFSQKEERKSVVALCKVSGLSDFSNHLKNVMGIELPLQPTHVTLYTLQPDAGIGLNNSNDIKIKSVSIEVPVSVRNGLGIV